MDKEVLVHEREELCKALSEQSKQIEELSQRRAHEDEARESFEARACALQEEVRDRVLALFSRGSWPAESYFFFPVLLFFRSSFLLV
jgi:vacuolar-type H+-ATPase subunit I/STV1